MMTASEAKAVVTLMAMAKIEVVNKIILESIEKGHLFTPYIKSSIWRGDLDDSLCTEVLRDYYTSLGYEFFKDRDKDIRIFWNKAN